MNNAQSTDKNRDEFYTRPAIAPSLLACDFSVIGEQLAELERAGCSWLHLDVMDGIFVPNISFGQPLLRSLRKRFGFIFDTHLMITQPVRYIGDFADAGADIITVHLESDDNILPALKKIRECGKKAGLSIKPKTDPNRLKPFLGEVDMILVMTVEPGFGGQKLIPETLESIKTVRRLVGESGHNIVIQADGGIDCSNISRVCSAGASVVVAGSSVFGAESIYDGFRQLSELL